MRGKRLRFWIHYNKPAAAKAGHAMWTVHWKGECLVTPRISLMAHAETHARNSQPRGVIRGWATSVTVLPDRIEVEDTRRKGKGEP